MTLTPKVLFKIALLIAGCALFYFFWKIAIALVIFLILSLIVPKSAFKKDDDNERYEYTKRYDQHTDTWYHC